MTTPPANSPAAAIDSNALDRATGVVAAGYKAGSKSGKVHNALRPESAPANENLEVILCAGMSGDREWGERKFRIRQITRQFARRIVCWVRPGDLLARGEIFGTIKLSSRTELVLPDGESLKILVEIGDKVCAGSTILARYRHRIGHHSTQVNSSDP